MGKLTVGFEWFAEIAAGLLFAAYALVAVGSVVLAVLAGLHVI